MMQLYTRRHWLSDMLTRMQGMLAKTKAVR
jgi:hypothetical protein